MATSNSPHRWVFALAIVVLQASAGAASLKPETAQAWEEYLKTADSRMQERLRPGNQFLWIDEDPDRLATVRDGQPVVAAVGQNPKKVPSGLIHDWAGAVFIPGVTLDQVLSVVRDYAHYDEFYKPAVIQCKVVAKSGEDDRFSMRLMNKSVLLRTALDSDYKASYFRVDDRRWYSIARTTRVQEIEHYGEAGEQMLREDEGHGLIWRLMSISRFEERDGGVYVEVEAIALSRDIPVSLRWMVTPIVRRVSKGSMLTTLQETQNAVRPETLAAVRGGASGGGAAASSVHSAAVQSFH